MNSKPQPMTRRDRSLFFSALAAALSLSGPSGSTMTLTAPRDPGSTAAFRHEPLGFPNPIYRPKPSDRIRNKQLRIRAYRSRKGLVL